LFKPDGSNYADKIYKINVKDNTQSYLNLKNNMYMSDIFFMDKENVLIIHYNIAGSAQLTKYNLREEKNEFTISDDTVAANVYYDIKSGYIYLLKVTGSSIAAMYENAEMMKAEITDGKLNIISTKKFSNHNSEPVSKFYASDSGYIIFYQDNFVAVRKFNEDTSNILNIYMYGTGMTWLENSIRAFQKDYGVEINIISHEDNRFEKMKLKLLANDTDFDLFMIDTSTGIDIFNKGAYEPLDGYPGVMKNISEMYPGMQKLLKYNGKTVGIPMQQVVMTTYAFNEELARKYDIAPPIIENGIWTLDEYYEYAKYVKEKSGGVVYLSSILWIRAYTTEYINPVTGELTDDGENLKRIIKWNKDFEELWDDNIKSNYENNLLKWSMSGYNMLYDETLIPVPFINKNAKIRTMYWMLCVNKYSRNKELAAQFLEYMTSEERRYDNLSLVLYNAIDKYEIYKIPENRITITDRMRYNSDYLNVLYENSSFEYQVRDDNFNELYFDLSDKYMNNEISLDSIATELYNKLKMITGE
jgi:ABC-type glycerol-3-phosphate transport system substrate-binding protein